MAPLKPHRKYDLQGGDLTVILDDTRFRVNSHFFLESPIFKKWFEAPALDAAGKSQKEKTSFEITISPGEGVTPDDFAKLCWVFYNEKLSVYDAPLDDWKTILRLAIKYKFNEVKDLAFRELDKPGAFNLPLTDRIALYRQNEAEKKYLEPLWAELLSRPEPLTIEEGKKLGGETTILIAGARERLRASVDRLPESTRGSVQSIIAPLLTQKVLPDVGRLNLNGLTPSAPATMNGLFPPKSNKK